MTSDLGNSDAEFMSGAVQFDNSSERSTKSSFLHPVSNPTLIVMNTLPILLLSTIKKESIS